MTSQFHPESADLILSQDEARSIDATAMEALGIPGLVLMENAARGVAEQLQVVSESSEVTILCGPGNNGGDGLAVARQRAAIGLISHVVLVSGGKPLSADTESNLEFLTRSDTPVQLSVDDSDCQSLLSDLMPEDWIVDSLLGTGVRGSLRSPFAGWVRAINSSPAHVMAVDVPSGLNCDDGTCGNDCVQADITVTFVGIKRGLMRPSAAKYTGNVVVSHIGIPVKWTYQWLSKFRHLNPEDDSSARHPG